MQDIITGLNDLIEAVKNAKSYYDMQNYPEVKKILDTLEIDLTEVKSRVAELITEDTALKDENRELKAPKKDEMVMKNNAYYDQNGNGPFCVACYTRKKLKVPLTDAVKEFISAGNKKCPVCNARYRME